MNKNHRVLVCGAFGFLGRNIFERLQQRTNLDVVGTFFSKREFRSIPEMGFANFMLEDDCVKWTRGFDTVIQCAALTAGSGRKCDWPFFAGQNIRMNQNLIEAAVANKVKHFIFLSCSVMYPVNAELPVQEEQVEENKIHPNYFIGAKAKLIIEDLMKMYSRFGDGISFTSIRHSNIYGPYDKFDLQNSHVLAATIQKAMTSKNGQLNMRGGKNTIRDLLYVSDFLNFVEDAVVFGPRENFEVFNVGSGSGITIENLAKIVARLSGRKLEIVFEREKDIAPTSIVLDIKKACKIMGWKPVFTLEEGIQKTMEWWRKNNEVKS